MSEVVFHLLILASARLGARGLRLPVAAFLEGRRGIEQEMFVCPSILSPLLPLGLGFFFPRNLDSDAPSTFQLELSRSLACSSPLMEDLAIYRLVMHGNWFNDFHCAVSSVDDTSRYDHKARPETLSWHWVVGPGYIYLTSSFKVLS